MGQREGEGAACVVCEAPLDASRCGHCGAAVTPGGYRVRRVISQSVHGRVYLAEDPEGRRVALKELLFALVPGTEQLDAFEREAEVLRSLSHPDIPRFVASFREGSGVGTRLYLAQEFLEGESLQQRIERQRLDEDEAWTLAEQVLGTLHALHLRTPALIHRDVKPANLILRPDGRTALVDFGAARHLARDVTHGSTLVGTFGYMPPEQLGGTVEPSSDLYALGATLVHALSGRVPADLLDDGLALSFEKHVRVSDSLRAFLRRLLAPRRSERFGSAAEALTALRAARDVAPTLGEVPAERNVHSAPLAGGVGSWWARLMRPVPARGPMQPEVSGPLAGGLEARGRSSAVVPPEVARLTRLMRRFSPDPRLRRDVAEGPSSEAQQAQAERAAARPRHEEGGASTGDEEARRVQATAASEGQGATETTTHAVSPVSKRRTLRWALVGMSVAGLLAGALLASGVLEPPPQVVVVEDDPSRWGAPPQPVPSAAPSRPAPPSGNGSHRHFRTPWNASGSR
ncbi:serine/threonine protein kinase [Pyxidicoccus fallax]|uniref:non-specific serine/threonine protein kinase n=1 Tax=Pyxidicoccus fallax TaxID=394095 RepID=A0A848LSZ8_9BACT|nr:serine/threonine-protein kinase [Pyxidicoccus fallax]NMO20896.1 serine/threonine protein kinase [Pyxidicoccus fallax]NPC81928.1 serine/threonine protein kinase [Pyxidicoccus fallax]